MQDVRVAVKVYHLPGDDIRRFSFKAGLSFADFSVLLKPNQLENYDIKIKYLDEEGDWITVENEEEFQEAVYAYKKPLMLIRVYSTPHPAQPKEKIKKTCHASFDLTEDVHTGILCDHCHQMNIKGVRYKCNECQDYDLCEKCINNSKEFHNSSHTFIPITNPMKRKHKCRSHHYMRKSRNYGIVCDGCQATDFEGKRWKCDVCFDFDLCEKCYTQVNTCHPCGHAFHLIEPQPWRGCREFRRRRKEELRRMRDSLKCNSLSETSHPSGTTSIPEDKTTENKNKTSECIHNQPLAPQISILQKEENPPFASELTKPTEQEILPQKSDNNADPLKYSYHLSVLAEMGFLNAELSYQLLEKYNGEIPLVVQEYLITPELCN